MSDTLSRPVLELVQELYPERKSKILEVSHQSSVAAELTEAGYPVSVTTLREGPEPLDAFEERFDLILFTAPLHRIHPLGATLTRAKKILSEKGRLLAFDLALEKMDEKTAEWFFDLHDLLSVSGVVNRLEMDDLTKERPLEYWQKWQAANPPHHTSRDLVRELERYFGTVQTSPVPFLYRLFPGNAASLPAAQAKILELEKRAIDRGLIQPMGVRFISKKYFSYLR